MGKIYIGKTYKHKKRLQNSRKNRIPTNSGKLNSFEKDITIYFLEMLMMVKLFHWKTTSYAAHKASDELYTSLNENIDKFIEVLLGKAQNRIDLGGQKTISVVNLDSSKLMREKIDTVKSYLVGLNDNNAMKLMSNSDLLNIRDEILGNLNQFLYLLTFR